MQASIAFGWGLALGVLVAAAIAAPKDGRPWVRRATALVLLYLIALTVAGWLLPGRLAVWAVAIAPVAVLLAAQPFIALGVLSRDELGLRAPAAGTARVVALAIGLALALNVAVMVLRGPSRVEIGPALLVAVLVAAVLEELVFRGVVLGLLDRAFPARWRLLGANVGWGGVIVTLVFITLHGLRPGMLLGIAPAAMLYLWLRARTGSLLAPITAHLAWNLSVILVH
jgi:uncharacterized protein